MGIDDMKYCMPDNQALLLILNSNGMCKVWA